MVIKARGEILSPTEQMNLTIKFKDSSGNLIDLDSYPRISIVQPSDLVFLNPTSLGISREGVGTYNYVFTAPINASYGIWRDIWSGYVNGFRVESEFQFMVNYTQVPGPNIDGYIAIGDDPGLDFSQAAIININKLIKSLKVRLNSSGKVRAKDSFGNVVYVDCDTFSIDMLTTMLSTALWDFNQVPYFTSFTFDDSAFVNQFGEILVEGATLYALASKALIERGREFQMTDNGVNFNLPTVSEIMMTQYSALLTTYTDKLKYIKNSIRPHPLGLGIFSMSSSGLNSSIRRLRHLRERRIF